MSQQVTINISWQTIWRIFAALILAAVFYLSYKVLLAFLLGIIIASALEGAVTYLENRRVPRILGTLLIFSAAISIVFFVLYNIVPLIIFELNALLKTMGNLNGDFLSNLANLLENLNRDFIIPNLDAVTNSLFQGSVSLLTAVKVFFGSASLILLTIVIAFYLTLSRDGVGKLLRSLFPDRTEDYILEIYYRAKQKIGRWLQAQIMLGLSIGLLVFIGLSIIGVKYSWLLAILAAIFELIPVVGPIFSGLIAVLIAFITTLSLSTSLWTLLVFLVIQFLENNVLVPLFMRRAVYLHPVVIIIALMIGFSVFGIMGMIIAVPTVVVIQEIIEGRIRKKPQSPLPIP